MGNPLDKVKNWPALAKECHFKVGKMAVQTGHSLRTVERFFQSKFHKTLRDATAEWKSKQINELARSGRLAKEMIEEVGFSHCSSLSRFLRDNRKSASWHRRRPQALLSQKAKKEESTSSGP
jgi:transcriptional regulator GlxA family with amidase domain